MGVPRGRVSGVSPRWGNAPHGVASYAEWQRHLTQMALRPGKDSPRRHRGTEPDVLVRALFRANRCADLSQDAAHTMGSEFSTHLPRPAANPRNLVREKEEDTACPLPFDSPCLPREATLPRPTRLTWCVSVVSLNCNRIGEMAGVSKCGVSANEPETSLPWKAGRDTRGDPRLQRMRLLLAIQRTDTATRPGSSEGYVVRHRCRPWLRGRCRGRWV